MFFEKLSKDLFEPYINSVQDFGIVSENPQVSIIIVAYRTNQLILDNLESLKLQNNRNFEIILVDNGNNEAVIDQITRYPLLFIRLKKNFKPSFARNLGTTYAKGSVICFLDDDAISNPDFVNQHIMIHKQNRFLGVRGKIIPKTKSIYNCLAYHYNLGEDLIPSYVDMENNASFPKDVLIEVGGFNPEIFAGEGAELSYRIVKKYGRKEALVYWPQAVIYHDYADSLRKYIKKTWRGAKMRVKIERLHPDYWSFIESYHPFPAGDIPRPRNLIERGQLAFVRRLGRLTRTLGHYWYSNQH